MTQNDFAKHLDVTQSQISRWEHGDYNFSLDKIADIAAKLNLDVNLSFIDATIYESASTHCAAERPLTFVCSSSQFTKQSFVYNTNSLKSNSTYIKEESNYVTIR